MQDASATVSAKPNEASKVGKKKQSKQSAADDALLSSQLMFGTNIIS